MSVEGNGSRTPEMPRGSNADGRGMGRTTKVAHMTEEELWKRASVTKQPMAHTAYRISEEHKELLRRAAKAEGVDTSGLTRRIVVEYLHAAMSRRGETTKRQRTSNDRD